MTLSVLETQVDNLGDALMSMKVAGEKETVIKSRMLNMVADNSFSRSITDSK